MSRFRHLFTKEIKPRFFSYISPILNMFKASSPTPPTKEILSKKLEIQAGMESELENPDSLLNNKSKDLRFYDTIAGDDKVKSCLELKKRLALSSKGDVIPASDEEQDKVIADFCRWQFENMRINFYDLMDNFLDGQQYGFKVGEIVWANQETMNKIGKDVPEEFNGKWFVSNIKHKHSIFFDFDYDDYGGVDALYIGRQFGDDTVIKGEELNNKFLIFVYPYPKDGNYYGDSDLKEVYPQWFAKFNIFRFRNQYLERYGMPIPEIIYDTKTTNATEKDDLNKMLKNFQDCMYFLTPGAYNKEAKDIIGKFKIVLHEVRNGAATKQYEDAIDQIDKQIARKLLIPDKLGFSETTTGSYSLGETQYKIFVAVIEDLQQKLEALINKLIIKIVDFNYFNVKDYPTWQFGKLSQTVKEEMLKILLEKGVIDKRESWIRKYIGVPELDEKEKEQIEKDKEEEIKKNQENFPPMQQPFGGQPNNQLPNNKPNNQPPNQKPDQKKFKVTTHPLNFKAVEKHYDEAEVEFIRDYNFIWMENTKYLIKQVESQKIIEEQKLKEIENLKIKKTELKRLFQNYFTKLYVTGRIDSIEEIQARLKRVQTEGFKHNIIEMKVYEYLDRDYINSLLNRYGELGQLTEWDGEGFRLIKDRAYVNAGLTEKQMLSTVSNTIYEGTRNNKTMKDIIQNISKHLTDENQKYATTIARTGASDFYNQGRMNLFNSKNVNPYITAYQYIAIIDNATTEFCRSHDEQIIQKDDPQVSLINPPNHFNALCSGNNYIFTIDGEKLIEDIKIGDLVKTHTGEYQKVYDIMGKFEDKDYYEITLDNNKTIYITAEHPVYVYHKERTIGGIKRYYVWFRADNLNFDNEIVCSDGKAYKIKSIIKKKVTGSLHNIAVEGDESYIANGIVVHNCRSIMSPIFLGENEIADSYYYDYENNPKMPAWGSKRNGAGEIFDISKPAIRNPAKGFGG